jgi:hypothetical protein
VLRDVAGPPNVFPVCCARPACGASDAARRLLRLNEHPEGARSNRRDAVAPAVSEARSAGFGTAARLHHWRVMRRDHCRDERRTRQQQIATGVTAPHRRVEELRSPSDADRCND